MELLSILLIVSGLSFFEIVTSIDNAIINAEVLSTMKEKARKFFLFWGLLFAVFVVRGLLPLVIVWLTVPHIGVIEAFTATLRGDTRVVDAVELSSHILLAGGGVFLLFLFLHWLFVEPKNYGLIGERFIHSQGAWFFAVVSILLAIIVWLALQRNQMMAFGAVVGSTAFFITHGFKQYAEHEEKNLIKKPRSDLSKIFYLEIIDATFSIDGVLGAFAFTLSVPLILIGNGIGALVLRQLTIGNIHRIKKYTYLKNGAMYSIFFLGMIMILDSFGFDVPVWLSPIITFGVVGLFFLKSHKENSKTKIKF